MNLLVKKVILPLLSLRAKKYQKLLSEIQELGIDIDDSKKTLDFFFEKTDFCVDSGILEQIDKDDFIEIYDKFRVQIFRTFNLYKYSTYSLDDLFTKRVDQLYDRPEFYTKLILKSAEKIFSRKSNFLTQFCPEHEVHEKKEFGTSVTISYKFMAPVYDKELKDIVGVIVCERLRASKSISS